MASRAQKRSNQQTSRKRLKKATNKPNPIDACSKIYNIHIDFTAKSIVLCIYPLLLSLQLGMPTYVYCGCNEIQRKRKRKRKIHVHIPIDKHYHKHDLKTYVYYVVILSIFLSMVCDTTKISFAAVITIAVCSVCDVLLIVNCLDDLVENSHVERMYKVFCVVLGGRNKDKNNRINSTQS